MPNEWVRRIFIMRNCSKAGFLPKVDYCQSCGAYSFLVRHHWYEGATVFVTLVCRHCNRILKSASCGFSTNSNCMQFDLTKIDQQCIDRQLRNRYTQNYKHLAIDDDIFNIFREFSKRHNCKNDSIALRLLLIVDAIRHKEYVNNKSINLFKEYFSDTKILGGTTNG